jgi:hypothetical protein
MLANAKSLGLLLILSLISVACEIDTKLQVEEGNPPKITLSGSGTLTRLIIVGHKMLRRTEGPDSSAVWCIKMTDYDNGQQVWQLSPIRYGKMPEGYIQIYPEQGEAPQLEENVTYRIQVDTSGANGASGYFMIKDGKVTFAEYESELLKS